MVTEAENWKAAERIVMWACIENVAYIAAFIVVLLLLDGWARAWAIVPLLFINTVKIRRE
jgi:hypothetical protein